MEVKLLVEMDTFNIKYHCPLMITYQWVTI